MPTNNSRKSSTVFSESNFSTAAVLFRDTNSSLVPLLQSHFSCAYFSAHATAAPRFFDLMNESMLRTAVSIIASANTIPTSSSSRSCPSLPASINSEATWNEMEIERSDPIDESAPAAVPPAPDMTFEAMKTCVAARWELVHVYLDWQKKNGCAVLFLRQLPICITQRVNGKRSRSPLSKVAGVSSLVFGCTVGNIVAHSKLPGQRTTVFMHQLRCRLEVFARMHSSMQGEDKELLASGLAAGQVSKSVMGMLHEVAAVKIDSRLGGRRTVIGATAATLLVVEMASAAADDAEWVVANDMLCVVLERAVQTLVHSVQICEMAETSRGAEIRALQRAAAGARKARMLVFSLGVHGRQALVMQITSAARAAFPPAVVCSTTQTELLSRVAAGVELLSPRSMVPLEAVGVYVPLSAIPLGPEDSCDNMSSTESSVPSSVSSVCSESELYRCLDVG